jgi:hypothetical protein
MYFMLYKDNDYGSDRVQILYNRINPQGIWKFINIYEPDLLDDIPLNLTSLPAIYNVKKMELYEGEYVFEFVRSLGLSPVDQFQHPLNRRFNERDDNDIETIIKFQPPKSTEHMEQLYNQERQNYHGATPPSMNNFYSV